MNGMAVFSLSIKLYIHIKWINDFWYYSYCSIQQKKCTFPFIDYVILSLPSYTLLQVYPYMKSMFASLSFPPSGAVAGGYGLANGNTNELGVRRTEFPCSGTEEKLLDCGLVEWSCESQRASVSCQTLPGKDPPRTSN